MYDQVKSDNLKLQGLVNVLSSYKTLMRTQRSIGHRVEEEALTAINDFNDLASSAAQICNIGGIIDKTE